MDDVILMTLCCMTLTSRSKIQSRSKDKVMLQVPVGIALQWCSYAKGAECLVLPLLLSLIAYLCYILPKGMIF